MNDKPKDIARVRKGRPRVLSIIKEDIYDVKDYSRTYYETIYKEKIKGDYMCQSCNLICSVANKSRHNKTKFHIKNKELLESQEPLKD
jgi:hypothetical protein